jgi:hypothetical protein
MFQRLRPAVRKPLPAPPGRTHEAGEGGRPPGHPPSPLPPWGVARPGRWARAMGWPARLAERWPLALRAGHGGGTGRRTLGAAGDLGDGRRDTIRPWGRLGLSDELAVGYNRPCLSTEGKGARPTGAALPSGPRPGFFYAPWRPAA